MNALLEPVASLAKAVRASCKTAEWINDKHEKPIQVYHNKLVKQPHS